MIKKNSQGRELFSTLDLFKALNFSFYCDEGLEIIEFEPKAGFLIDQKFTDAGNNYHGPGEGDIPQDTGPGYTGNGEDGGFRLYSQLADIFLVHENSLFRPAFGIHIGFNQHSQGCHQGIRGLAGETQGNKIQLRVIAVGGEAHDFRGYKKGNRNGLFLIGETVSERYSIIGFTEKGEVFFTDRHNNFGAGHGTGIYDTTELLTQTFKIDLFGIQTQSPGHTGIKSHINGFKTVK